MKKQLLGFLCFVLISACAAPSRPAQQDDLTAQLVLAQDEIDAQQYELARSRLEYILERQPESSDALALLANIPTITPIPVTPKQNAQATYYHATVEARQTIHPTVVASLTPTSEPVFTPPARSITPALLGTALPDAPPISRDNSSRLEYAGQWGKGNILAIAATPDHSAFVVGSAFGFAIYDIQDLQNAPRWVAFDPPFTYDELIFSSDGGYLLLKGSTLHQVRSFPDGQLIHNATGISWIELNAPLDYENTDVTSPDGRYRFSSTSTYNEENWNIEFSIRKVYDAKDNTLLYELRDESTYVEYGDTHSPEGCDLYSFSMCGNVYDPSLNKPYRIGFSPTGSSFAVIYRAPNLWNSNQFSTLKFYDLKTGDFLNQIGSYSHPVETFGYLFDGRVVVGFVDGSIEIWNPGEEKSTFGAWHFNSPVETLDYSPDGKYIYIQRQGDLEIRRTSDGALFKRYEASTYAISPVANLIAIADDSGNIRLQSMTGTGDRLIQAHKARIYALAFSPDGTMLVSAGEDCAIRAWDVKTGAFAHPFENTVVDAYQEGYTASRIFIKYFRFIPGTNQLLGFGSWGTVVSWNINSGATNYVIESAPLQYYQGMITLNPHFPEFFGVDLTGSKFYINEIAYDLATGKMIQEQQQPEQVTPDCYAVGPVSADNSIVFTLGYKEKLGQICILDAQDGNLLGQIVVAPDNTLSENSANYQLVNWLYRSPDGKQLLAKTLGGAILVYQIVP